MHVRRCLKLLQAGQGQTQRILRNRSQPLLLGLMQVVYQLMTVLMRTYIQRCVRVSVCYCAVLSIGRSSESTCNLPRFQYLSCVHHIHVVRMLVWKLCIESTLCFYLLRTVRWAQVPDIICCSYTSDFSVL